MKCGEKKSFSKYEGQDLNRQAKTVAYAMRDSRSSKDLLLFEPDDKRTVQLHGYPARRRKEGVRARCGGLLVVRPDPEPVVHARPSAFEIMMPPPSAPLPPRVASASAHDRVQGQFLPDQEEEIKVILDHERRMEDFAYADELEAMDELGL